MPTEDHRLFHRLHTVPRCRILRFHLDFQRRNLDHYVGGHDRQPITAGSNPNLRSNPLEVGHHFKSVSTSHESER
ncbi:hypothetical protein A5710_00920 [Mycolicibacter sinensis]|uniref:Uncharacterized protein n=1 Tax=Mycolicibacter sinensis (strain JDM601) TaxID=875328 RepID=A0A1A2XF57_MYCSD|nr:hypothetical protein A5710_00920 [Mycolicibacter sinensis]